MITLDRQRKQHFASALSRSEKDRRAGAAVSSLHSYANCKPRPLYGSQEKLWDADVPIEGHMELIDQIRIRAREDGVPLSKIDAALKTRFYFTRDWKRQKQANLRAVARTVEYFGGRLVIDWCDR